MRVELSALVEGRGEQIDLAVRDVVALVPDGEGQMPEPHPASLRSPIADRVLVRPRGDGRRGTVAPFAGFEGGARREGGAVVPIRAASLPYMKPLMISLPTATLSGVVPCWINRRR